MNEIMLAAISGESLLWLVVQIIIFGMCYWLLDWAITKIALPDPFAKFSRIILILAVVVVLLNALLGLGGRAFIKW